MAVRACGELHERNPMMSDATGTAHDDEEPTTEELEEPSTEKDPGEEPKGGTDQEAEAEPDHEAVGIGVIGGPQTDTEDSPAG
jgi:hypothetical protein